VVRLATHHIDDGAVYTCKMTVGEMIQRCNITLNVTCTYYFNSVRHVTHLLLICCV